MGVRRIGLAAGLFVLTSLAVLATTSSAAATTTDATAMAGETVNAVGHVTVALTRSGATYKHPGFLMYPDEVGVFVINCDGKDHEVAISFKEVGDTRFTLLVEYTIGGHRQWIEELDVAAGEDTDLQKGQSKLTINVDPQGSEDTSRDENDKIEAPKEDPDGPLGGAPLL